jgi:hypothetical protein
VVANFAMVGCRECLLISYVAVSNFGIDKPMIGAFHALHHYAIKKCQGIT